MKSQIALTLLFLAGCATVQEKNSEPITKTIAAPRNKVWAALVSEVGSRYPVKAVDADSGVLSTDPALVDPNLFRSCTTVPQAMFALGFSPESRVSFRLVATGDNPTVVSVLAHWAMLNGPRWEVWPSNGVLESNILETVDAKIEGRTPNLIPIRVERRPMTENTNAVRKTRGQ